MTKDERRRTSEERLAMKENDERWAKNIGWCKSFVAQNSNLIRTIRFSTKKK